LRVAGRTLTQIAERYGLTRQRVAQIIDASEVGRVPTRHASQIRREERRCAARSDSRADEVLTLWRAGATREEIARRVGVTLEAIREIVAAHATHEDATDRRAACHDRLPVGVAARFSKLELIDGLWLVSERLGHVPTATEYQRVARELDLASLATVCARFGGWGSALEAAGLGKPSRSGGPAARWDTAACWGALLSVADQLGDPPRYRRYMEIARGRDDLPSGPTLTLRLGLWSEIAPTLAESAVAPVIEQVEELVA